MRPISLFLTFLLMAFAAAGASPAPPLLPPDARYKADMLIVVAHPDDDVVVGGYLARLALDELKQIAVVYCTTGDGVATPWDFRIGGKASERGEGMAYCAMLPCRRNADRLGQLSDPAHKTTSRHQAPVWVSSLHRSRAFVKLAKGRTPSSAALVATPVTPAVTKSSVYYEPLTPSRQSPTLAPCLLMNAG
jgi:hypothetical protein